MKYHFVYDSNIAEKNFALLSEEELSVVLACAIGGHSAMFYGYKPERLINTLKLLMCNTQFTEPETETSDVSITQMCGGGKGKIKGLVAKADGGVLAIKNIDECRMSVIQMLAPTMDNGVINLCYAGESYQFPTHFQLLTTAKSCLCGNLRSSDKLCLCSLTELKGYWNRLTTITDRCPIVYYCCEGAERSPHSISHMRELAMKAWNYHARYFGTKKANEMDWMDFILTTEGQMCYKTTVQDVPYYNKVQTKILRVARSIADTRGHHLIRRMDVDFARSLYKPITETN